MLAYKERGDHQNRRLGNSHSAVKLLLERASAAVLFSTTFQRRMSSDIKKGGRI